MIVLLWQFGCVVTPFYHAEKSLWVFIFNCPTSFYNRPPEYNPDELLNSDLKRGIGKRPSPRSEAELEHNVRSHLKSVQLKLGKINGFFGSSTTFYAA